MLRCAFAICWLSRALYAADIYVATTGSDSNPGTPAQPFHTIQKGIQSATAGATIFVTAGVYNEALTFNASGSAAGGYITLSTFAADAVAIDGTGLSVNAGTGLAALISITDQSYIRIQGFELRNLQTTKLNSLVAGVFVQGAGSNIEIRNCHVHDIANKATIKIGGLGRDAHGIAFYGRNGATPLSALVVDGCEVDHCTLGSSESLTMNGNIDGFQVTHCSVHDNDNIGIVAIGWEKTAPANDQARNGAISDNVVYNIHSKGNPAYGNDSSAGGLYCDGSRDNTLERNFIYQCDVGIEVGCEHRGKTCSGVTVRDNAIHHCVLTGLAFGGYDGRRGMTLDCTFLNNTLFANDTSNSGSGEIMVQVSKNNVLKNNVLYAGAQGVLISNPFAKAKSSDNVFDYNLYFSSAANGVSFQQARKQYTSLATWQSAAKQDAHSTFADPQFVSAATPDLHVLPTSPAVDAGDPSVIPAAGETDLDGKPRVLGSAEDRGAYER